MEPRKLGLNKDNYWCFNSELTDWQDRKIEGWINRESDIIVERYMIAEPVKIKRWLKDI